MRWRQSEGGPARVAEEHGSKSLRSMFGVVLVTAFCSLVVCALLTFPTGSARLLCYVPDAFVSACSRDMFFRRDVFQPW